MARGGASVPAARRPALLDRPLPAVWPPEAITPVTNMVDRLRRVERVTALLGQSQSTYRVREAMDGGKIVLACPGAGGTRDRLIANLLALRPAARRARSRRPGARAAQAVLGLPRRGAELRRRRLGQPRRALGAERQVRAAGGAAQPEPRAPQRRDAERADDQPLAPARLDAQLARRRPHDQGVGRASELPRR